VRVAPLPGWGLRRRATQPGPDPAPEETAAEAPSAGLSPRRAPRAALPAHLLDRFFGFFFV